MAQKGKGLHPKNIHKDGYDFDGLVATCPDLKKHVVLNKYGTKSIDFADAVAVRVLNTALLAHYYGINGWSIPEGFLCPPIPGRVDYIHYVADLLCEGGPSKRPLKLLDVGTGANGVYALLAAKVYGWECVACDIDSDSLSNVDLILNKNPALRDKVELRLQKDKSHIFEGIIAEGEVFDMSVCNPPFHASLEEALKANLRKRNNLEANRTSNNRPVGKAADRSSQNKNNAPLNFGGQKAELWCKGGEHLFLRKMIKESVLFSSQCRWFTSLVSKSDNLKPAKKLLRKLDAIEVREIELLQGNKITRILAWRFI